MRVSEACKILSNAEKHEFPLFVNFYTWNAEYHLMKNNACFINLQT